MAPASASNAEGADTVGTTDLKAPIIVVAPSDQWEHQEGDLVLGRGEDASIVIDDPLVSRKHARIGFESDGAAIVEDLSSTNGTFLNGTRMTRPTARLHDGDRLLLGTTELSVFAARPAAGAVSASKRVCAIGLIRQSDPARASSSRSPALQKALAEEQTVQRQLFEPGALHRSPTGPGSARPTLKEPAANPVAADFPAPQGPRDALARAYGDVADDSGATPPSSHGSARGSGSRIALPTSSSPPITDEPHAAPISSRSPGFDAAVRSAPDSEGSLRAAPRQVVYITPARPTPPASVPASLQPLSEDSAGRSSPRPARLSSDATTCDEALYDPTCHVAPKRESVPGEGDPSPSSRRGVGSGKPHGQPPSVRSHEPPTRPSKPTTERSDTAELVGRLADRLVAAGKLHDAIRVLSEHLKNLLGGASAGLPVPDHVLVLGTRYALRLHEWTRQTDWIDYVFQLHLACQKLPSSASLDLLEPACGPEARIDRGAIEYLVHGLSVRGASDSPDRATRFLRLSRLARVPHAPDSK